MTLTDKEKLEAIKKRLDKLDVPYDHAQMYNAIQEIMIILRKNEKIKEALEKIDKMRMQQVVNTQRHSGALIADLNELKKILEK